MFTSNCVCLTSFRNKQVTPPKTPAVPDLCGAISPSSFNSILGCFFLLLTDFTVMMKCRDTFGFCITAAFHTDSAPELSGCLLEQQCLFLAAPMHQSVQYPARVKCGGKVEHHVSPWQTIQTGIHRHYCRDIVSLLGCWKPFLAMNDLSINSKFILNIEIPFNFTVLRWRLKYEGTYLKTGQIQPKLSTWLDTTRGTVSENKLLYECAALSSSFCHVVSYH